MNFLSPFFLWLLPTILIPIIIYLLNRQNTNTINFSTLRFFKELEKDSIKKIRLLQLILLILRTIIILLIILMITRPIIKNVNLNNNSINSSLQIIIFDNTFSMKGNDDIVLKCASTIINQIDDKKEILWINIKGGLQYSGLREDLPKLKNLMKYTYHAGSITDALFTIKENISNKHSDTEIYVITDKQVNNLNTLINESKNFINSNFYVFIASPLNKNLSIVNASLSNDVLSPNHPFEINALIKNTGKHNIDDALVQLVVNNTTVGQQLISLPPLSNKNIIFKTTLDNVGIHPAEIQLNNDNRNEDNRYYFNILLPEQIKIAFIGINNDNYYIKESINALNEKSKIFTLSEYNKLNGKYHEIFKNDIIIMNPEIISNNKDSQINEYIYNGGHIIIIPTNNSLPDDFNALDILLSDSNDQYENLILNEYSEGSYQEIDFTHLQINQIKNIFLSNHSNNRNIRFFKYISLPYNPSNSQLLLKNGSTIWNRYNLNKGIIDIYGFSMNLNWTNFPIKGGFLPLMHYLTYSKYFNNNLSTFVNNQWSMIPQYFSNNIIHTSPDGSRKLINMNKTQLIRTDVLDIPGHHSLSSDIGVIGQIAANINEEELNNELIDIKAIKSNISDNIHFINMEDNLEENIYKARIGTELWRIILYLIIALLMIEMLVSNPKRNR